MFGLGGAWPWGGLLDLSLEFMGVGLPISGFPGLQD